MLASAALLGSGKDDAQAQTSSVQNVGTGSLRVASVSSVMESGMLLRAAELWEDGRAATFDGGVANLWMSTDVGGHPVVADLAGNSETQMLHVSARNPGCRILFTVAEGLYRIVGRRSLGVSDPASLRGKRIGTMAETSAAYFLYSVLEQAGLSRDQVSMIPLMPAQMTEMLVAGTIDAMAIWEPEPQRAAELLGADAVEFRPQAAYRELYNLYATEDLLSVPAKRKQVVSFVRSLRAACQEAATNPGRIQALLTERSHYSLDLIQACWPNLRFPAALPDDLLDVLVGEERWQAQAEARVPRDREQLATLIDTSILKEASAPP